MRSGLRTTLIAAVVACHATVLSAGPALHGLLGLDHGRIGAAERPADHRADLSHSADDCVACHLLSLVQFTPEPGPGLSLPRVDRAPLDSSPLLQPTDALGRDSTRAPPAPLHHARAV